MIDFAGLGYVQIDAGRIGGITTAKRVADYAHARGVQFVNHTFTNHLALSASLQPYAGLREHALCEYPFAPSALARELTARRLEPDADGLLRLPERPGLGLEPDPQALEKYRVEIEIKVNGKLILPAAHPGALASPERKNLDSLA
jgi:L-alanine-DL-glutamate epimerase-like enolase superfamily enzyme